MKSLPVYFWSQKMYSKLMKYFNLVCLMCMSILPECISVYQVFT